MSLLVLLGLATSSLALQSQSPALTQVGSDPSPHISADEQLTSLILAIVTNLVPSLLQYRLFGTFAILLALDTFNATVLENWDFFKITAGNSFYESKLLFSSLS